MIELQQYNFTIVYRSGKSNANADALSRIPELKENDEDLHHLDRINERNISQSLKRKHPEACICEECYQYWRQEQQEGSKQQRYINHADDICIESFDSEYGEMPEEELIRLYTQNTPEQIYDKNIWEEISDAQEQIQLGNRLVNSRAYVARFNFSGSDQQKKVGALSGGERNRVHLAKMLKEGANVLLLDEPTNDLDINTMRALEAALENFAGCAVVISHDRWFLDRIATHILAFEGDSRVVWFEGNFSDYEEDKRARLGDAAAQPHRIKYRQLTRG